MELLLIEGPTAARFRWTLLFLPGLLTVRPLDVVVFFFLELRRFFFRWGPGVVSMDDEVHTRFTVYRALLLKLLSTRAVHRALREVFTRA